jgi:hypothetical protein
VPDPAQKGLHGASISSLLPIHAQPPGTFGASYPSGPAPYLALRAT